MLTFLLLLPVLAAVALLGIPPLRRRVVTRPLMTALGRSFPRVSETERVALEAGTVWWEKDLFSGRPDWEGILSTRLPGLSAAERAFLAGPVEEVCALAVAHDIDTLGDLPPEVWEALKQHRFFGMIIPEEYGGLGFSAQAHSAVVARCASRSVALAVTIMVPNSLGPAELLLHYGTDEEKEYYLSRLASGEEIPCFALTEPGAGSDAAGITSRGVVCRGTWQGKDVIGMRLTWDKRYATLAPVATLIGLAFQLEDPENHLGLGVAPGITCALIPADLPGIEIGARHDPLGVPFHNGPTRGDGVFVPVEAIIGGPRLAGQGWRMLMQCLAAGRSISLPALAVGAAQLAARTAGAYASVREQFGLPIGRFEGVEEPLARIGGLAYLMNAARSVTASAVDLGEKPSVVSAIVKRYLTEGMRQVVNDAMDILGGAGISRGPGNIMAGAYTSAPIGITVEGANILTRTLIIFGQGAIRCHPYARAEIEALGKKDVAAFDAAFFAHLRFAASRFTRATFLAAGGWRLTRVPRGGEAGKMTREIDRYSAAFSLCAEMAMATLGGNLKRREKLSGRLADALAWLYMGTAMVKRYVDDGQPERDRHLAAWGHRHACHEIEAALDGFLDNLPARGAARLARWAIFPWGRRANPPSDALGGKVARLMLDGSLAWQALTSDIYLPPRDEPGLGRLEEALARVVAARPHAAHLREAVQKGRLAADPAATLVERAVAAGVLTAHEAEVLLEARAAREAAVSVDTFETRLAHGSARAS